MQPLASLQALDDPIYEAFYGLNDQPFSIATDPKFFYLSASHQRAFSELLNGLRRGEGLLQLTGETGTGKTTLCRAVVEALGPKAISALVLNPYMSGPEVLRIVLRDFGLISHEDLRRGTLAAADTPQLLDTLEGFLKSLIPLGTHAVVILDEAQSLAPQVLDQVRLLTSLELNGQRLVQVILCGQPGLLNTLKDETLYALNERITRRIALLPMPSEEVGPYIQHRLGVAGGGEAITFEPGALRVIAELSHGLPRRVNVLCDRTLQEGRIEGVNIISGDLVKRAARALAGAHDPTPVAPPEPVVVSAGPALGSLTFGQEASPAQRKSWTGVLVGAGVVVLVAAGAGLYARQIVTSGSVVPPAPLGPPRAYGLAAAPLPVPAVDEPSGALTAMAGSAGATAGIGTGPVIGAPPSLIGSGAPPTNGGAAATPRPTSASPDGTPAQPASGPRPAAPAAASGEPAATPSAQAPAAPAPTPAGSGQAPDNRN